MLLHHYFFTVVLLIAVNLMSLLISAMLLHHYFFTVVLLIAVNLMSLFNLENVTVFGSGSSRTANNVSFC